MSYILTDHAARILQVSTRRVRALITAGRLPASKVGRDYFINEADLALVKIRKTGRPPGRATRR